MTYLAVTTVMDGLLSSVAARATQYFALKGDVGTYASIASVMLASSPISAADFTLADYTSGRQCTVGQKSNVSITNTGTVNHAALADGSNLLYLTQTSTQILNAANQVTFLSWIFKVHNPVAG